MDIRHNGNWLVNFINNWCSAITGRKDTGNNFKSINVVYLSCSIDQEITVHTKDVKAQDRTCSQYIFSYTTIQNPQQDVQDIYPKYDSQKPRTLYPACPDH
jgi:hypothetical protein